MKILIVEDEPAFARELAETLKNWGHEVIKHLDSYTQTLQWLSETDELPDAAVLDLCLGGNYNRDGLKIAEVLFKEYSVPFVFNSGLDDPSTAFLTAEYGAVQVAKEEWKSLKNALIQIAAGRQMPAPAPLYPQESYETARISINDADNYGLEIVIPISKIVWLDTQLGNRASRIMLHVKDGNQIISYRNGHHTMSSFVQALDKKFPSLHLSDVFIQINKHTRINKNHISKRVGDEIYLGEKAFTIGDGYKEELKKYLPPKI